MTKTNLSRRSALKLGGAALALATVGGFYASSTASYAGHPVIPKPLQIPPENKGQMQDGVRVFDLNVQTGKTEFFEGLKTDTLGINGSYLGPTLRLKSGETIRLNVTNGLGETTTLHWHGFNLPAVTDGGPHQEIDPGTVWSPEFVVREKAAAMWYHSHQFHKTADQVWAGMAGMALVDDDESSALDLPDTYGVDDIPVVLQDRSFRRNGQMPYISSMQSRMMGLSGDISMVNGTITPYFDVTTSLIRLRLLNGANASIYTLEFADGREFSQISSDGGLLEAPAQMRSLKLSPGERADIVVDMSDGSVATLRSVSAGGGGGGGMMGGMMSSGPAFDFLELRPAASLTTSPALPDRLAALPAVSDNGVTRTRKFVLQMSGMGPFAKFLINGKSMDMDRIDEVIEKGVSEIWEVSNTSPMAHPFHVHNTQFRILDRNGAAPHAGERGLKDTVLVNPQERVRILVRFDNYTDADNPYMYHCHILEHEDAGMMGQFTVV
jgi:FtsP/CotA-like multicopper oxidase with cupredoxin domain